MQVGLDGYITERCVLHSRSTAILGQKKPSYPIINFVGHVGDCAMFSIAPTSTVICQHSYISLTSYSKRWNACQTQLIHYKPYTTCALHSDDGQASQMRNSRNNAVVIPYHAHLPNDVSHGRITLKCHVSQKMKSCTISKQYWDYSACWSNSKESKITPAIFSLMDYDFNEPLVSNDKITQMVYWLVSRSGT